MIITICGSYKFDKEILSEYERVSLAGHLVFLPSGFFRTEELSEEELERVRILHFQKILISDAIYVVNVNGYIGEHTAKEIEYAELERKEVLYFEPINDWCKNDIPINDEFSMNSLRAAINREREQIALNSSDNAKKLRDLQMVHNPFTVEY